MSTPLKHTTKLQIAIPVVGLFFAFAFCVMVIFITSFHVYQLVGGLVMLISLLLWIIARAQLGDAPSQKRFVTTGLYNELRHPIYTFQTTTAIGFAMFLWIGLLWIPVIALVVFQVTRVRREEQRLLAIFGRRYRNYLQRTVF